MIPTAYDQHFPVLCDDLWVPCCPFCHDEGLADDETHWWVVVYNDEGELVATQDSDSWVARLAYSCCEAVDDTLAAVSKLVEGHVKASDPECRVCIAQKRSLATGEPAS